VFALEYGLLGTLTGLIALGAGTLGAWIVSVHVLEVDFAFDWPTAILTVAGGAAATLFLGLLGGLSALAAKPARILRNP